jgi:hypothetical protein
MIQRRRAVFLGVALFGALAAALGITLLAFGRSEGQLPPPGLYGLQCPAGDLIADVDIDFFPTEAGGAPTAIDALNKGVITDEPGLMSANVQQNPDASTGSEVEFFFEQSDGARIGRATVEKIDGNWYVTRYTACSSAQ